MSQMEFYSMKRKQLQALCKKHKLLANVTNLKMAESLASVLKVAEDSGTKEQSYLKDSEEILNRDSGGGANDVDVKKKLSKRVTFCSEKDQMYEYIDLESDPDEAQTPTKGVQTRRSSMARAETLKTDPGNAQMGPVENTRITRSRVRNSVGFPLAVQSPVNPRKMKRVAKTKQVEHEKPPPPKDGLREEIEKSGIEMILRRSKRQAPLVEKKTEQPGEKNGRFRKNVSEEASVHESEIVEKSESTGRTEGPRKRSRRKAPKGAVKSTTAGVSDVDAMDESKQSFKPLNNKMTENTAANIGTGITEKKHCRSEVQEPLRPSKSYAVSGDFVVAIGGKIGVTDEVDKENEHQNVLPSFVDNTTVLTETESITKYEESLRTWSELSRRSSGLKRSRQPLSEEKHPLADSKAEDEGSKRSKRDNTLKDFCEGKQVNIEGVTAAEACLPHNRSGVFSAIEQGEASEKLTSSGIVGLTKSQKSPRNWNCKIHCEAVSEETECVPQLEESPIPTGGSEYKFSEPVGRTGDLRQPRSPASQERFSASKNESKGEQLNATKNCTHIICPVKRVTFGDGDLQLEVGLKHELIGEISAAKLDESILKANSDASKDGFGELGVELGGTPMKLYDEAQKNLVYSHDSNTKSRLEDDQNFEGQHEIETTEADIIMGMEHRDETVEQVNKEIHLESSRITLFDSSTSVKKSKGMGDKDHSSAKRRVEQGSKEIHMESSRNILFDCSTSVVKSNRVVDKYHSSSKPNKRVVAIGSDLNERNEMGNGSIEALTAFESATASTESLVKKESKIDSRGENILEDGSPLQLDEPNLCEKEEEHASVSIKRLEQTDNIHVVKEMTCNSAETVAATEHVETKAVGVIEEHSTANCLKPMSLSDSDVEEKTTKTEAHFQLTTVGEKRELTQTVSTEPHCMSTIEKKESNESYISSLKCGLSVDIEQLTWLEENEQLDSCETSAKLSTQEVMSSVGAGFSFCCADDLGFPETSRTRDLTHPGLRDESEDLKLVLEGHKEDHRKSELVHNHLKEGDQESLDLSGRTGMFDFLIHDHEELASESETSENIKGIDHGELQDSTRAQAHQDEKTNSFSSQCFAHGEFEDSKLVHTHHYEQTNSFTTEIFEGDGEKWNGKTNSTLKEVVEVSCNDMVEEESLKIQDSARTKSVKNKFELDEQPEQLLGADRVELKECPIFSQEGLDFGDPDTVESSRKILDNSERKFSCEFFDIVAEVRENGETDVKGFVCGGCEVASHLGVQAIDNMREDIFALSNMFPTTGNCCQESLLEYVEKSPCQQTISPEKHEASAHEGSVYVDGMQIVSVRPNEEGEIPLVHKNEPPLDLEEEKVSLKNSAEPRIVDGEITLKEISGGHMKTDMMTNFKFADDVAVKKGAQQQKMKTDSKDFEEAYQNMEKQESSNVCGDISAMESIFQFIEDKLTGETNQFQCQINEHIHEFGGEKAYSVIGKNDDWLKVRDVKTRPESEVNEESPETSTTKSMSKDLENVENKVESQSASIDHENPVKAEVNTVDNICEHNLEVERSISFTPGTQGHCSQIEDTSEDHFLKHNSLEKVENNTETFLKEESMMNTMTWLICNGHHENLKVEIVDTIPGENKKESKGVDTISGELQYKDAEDSTQLADVKSEKHNLDSDGHGVISEFKYASNNLQMFYPELACNHKDTTEAETIDTFSSAEYNCHDTRKALEMVISEGIEAVTHSDCNKTGVEKKGNVKIAREGIVCCVSEGFIEHHHDECKETLRMEFIGSIAPQESTDNTHGEDRQEVQLVENKAIHNEEIENAKNAAADLECDNCEVIGLSTETNFSAGNIDGKKISTDEKPVLGDLYGESEQICIGCEDGLYPVQSVAVFIKEEFTEAGFNENETAAHFVETERVMGNQGCSWSSEGWLDCNLPTPGVGEECKESDGLQQLHVVHEGQEIEVNEKPNTTDFVPIAKAIATEEMEDHQVNRDALVAYTGEDCVGNHYTVAGEMTLFYKDDANNIDVKREGVYATCELDLDNAVEDASEEVLYKNKYFLLEEEKRCQEKEDNVCVGLEEKENQPEIVFAAKQHDQENPEAEPTEEQEEEDKTLSSINALFTTEETQDQDTKIQSKETTKVDQMEEAGLFHQLPSESLQMTKKSSSSRVQNKPLKLGENLKHLAIVYEMKENTSVVKKERSDNPKREKFFATGSIRRPLEDLQYSRKIE
ncbi:uncharacterized protein [Aristolochia californica]|uniref:uncharacterized protein isoform X2 n=1 Tax=Aristolochia californica TaxID=171875 RepID=UPI0035E1E93C